ncbi:MAG: glycosyltransferase [Bacteroidia bacterium]
MSPHNYHILFLTRWYPHQADPQLGIFIRKHAKAASQYCRVSVLNVRADENATEKFRIIKNEEENFSETIIHFKPASNRISNYLRFGKAHYKGLQYITMRYGVPQLMQMNVMYGLCMITFSINKRIKIPYIIAEHWHGFVDNKFRDKNFYFKELFRLTARKAKAIITVSEFLKNGMIANDLQSKYFVVPNVVESIAGIKKTTTDKIRMLTVADLDDDIKNISGVINTLSDLIGEGLTSIEYHIIGGGKDEKKLKQFALEKGLSNSYIIFHGLQPNDYVLEFLNEIDFVIINSRYETFSVIAAEALLAGKPLVCTRCGGVDDFVDSDCGYIINPGSNDELKNALASMIGNYSQFDSEKLKQKINNRFSSATVGKQLFDIYKMIVDNN